MSCMADRVSVSKRAEYAAKDFSGAEVSASLLGAIRSSDVHGAALLPNAAAPLFCAYEKNQTEYRI